MKRFKEFLDLLVEASEGDARKYMKKVLETMDLADELEDEYGEHWSEFAFNEIRSRFIHNGCDVYFTPGLARIAYGECYMGTDEEDTEKIRQLCQLVKFITMAHKSDFSRNLEHITTVQEGPTKGQKVKSKPFTLVDIQNMFSKEQERMSTEERNNFLKSTYTDNGYTIIELTDFETAHKYQPYTDLPGGDSWCYLEDEETFDSYRESGNRTYLALAPGFEKLKPGDEGYGRSMIGFDMSPVDETGRSDLEVCNNRYNHAPDLEHENGKTGDSKYNEIELSKILGFPVWEKCPGYTEEELAARGIITVKHVLNVLNTYADDIREILKKLLTFDTIKGNKDVQFITSDLETSLEDNYNLRCLFRLYNKFDNPIVTNNLIAVECMVSDANASEVADEIANVGILYIPKTDKLIISEHIILNNNFVIDCSNYRNNDIKIYNANISDEPIYNCKTFEQPNSLYSLTHSTRLCVFKTQDDNTIIYDTLNSKVIVDSDTINFDNIEYNRLSKVSFLLLNDMPVALLRVRNPYRDKEGKSALISLNIDKTNDIEVKRLKTDAETLAKINELRKLGSLE